MPPCYVGQGIAGNVCHCTADGGYAGAGEKQNHRQRGRGALLSGALYPSAYLDLCLYRNPWRYRRWLSAKYGWQAVFNTFGALAIAEKLYGLKGAVGLRVAANVFGVVFALLFCAAFYWVMERVTGRRIAGEQNI